MKRRLIGIILLSVFLAGISLPGALADALPFDEAALNQYLDAWQKEYAAKNFWQIDLEDSLLGGDEVWGFLLYSEGCAMGYDFDTRRFFAVVSASADFREDLKDIVFYAGDKVIHPLSLEYGDELGHVLELAEADMETMLACDEITLRLSFADGKNYLDITSSSHPILYQLGQHVDDAVDYCAYSSKLYQSASLLPESASLPTANTAANTGFVDDYVAINEKAQSMFLVEIYDENDQIMGTGSGFVAFDEHLFITNHHVIDEAAYLIVYDDMGNAHLIHYLLAADETLDIAILEFDSGFEYASLPLKENPSLLRGQPVIAIGSPKGVKNTVSSGNISALLQENGAEIIQFTAPADHGSSGGALFDNSGSVIGLVFAKHSEGQNMNYALNIQSVIDFKQQNAYNYAESLAVYNHLIAALPGNDDAAMDWDYETPDSEYTRYTHPVLGYSLEYPSAWVMMDMSNMNDIRSGKAGLDLPDLDWDSIAPAILQNNTAAFVDYWGYSSDFDTLDFASNITVSVNKLSLELSAEDYLTVMPDLRNEFSNSIPGISFLNEGSIYIAGDKEYCLLSYCDPSDEYDLYNYQFYISNGTTMYLVTLTLADNVIDLELVETYAHHLLSTLEFPRY